MGMMLYDSQISFRSGTGDIALTVGHERCEPIPAKYDDTVGLGPFAANERVLSESIFALGIIPLNESMSFLNQSIEEHRGWVLGFFTIMFERSQQEHIVDTERSDTMFHDVG